MLKKRIIPIVLLDGFSVLKTQKFNTRRNLGSPVTVMRTYNTRNVDELIILDIDASKQNRSIDHFTIKEITSDCFMPLTIGGGLKNCFDIEKILNCGADKVSLNSVAFDNPAFVAEAVNNFGSQCIVASVDIIKLAGSYYVYSRGKAVSHLDPLDWCEQLVMLGVGELLINDVSRDGTMDGVDIALANIFAERSTAPFIFTGGISVPQDAVSVLSHPNSRAVGVSSMFHFTNYTPEDCRIALLKAGIPARYESLLGIN